MRRIFHDRIVETRQLTLLDVGGAVGNTVRQQSNSFPGGERLGICVPGLCSVVLGVGNSYLRRFLLVNTDEGREDDKSPSISISSGVGVFLAKALLFFISPYSNSPVSLGYRMSSSYCILLLCIIIVVEVTGYTPSYATRKFIILYIHYYHI